MNIILGADGHVGSATAKALLKEGQPVTVVLHSDKNAAKWKEQDAVMAIVDVNDTDALHQIFKEGTKAFLLNPPAPPSTDTVAVEKKSVASILKALKGSGIQKVVAESTYGAQPGDGIGDLGVLYELEQGLKEMNIPATIIRAAYYMSNWDMSLETAQKEGMVHTLYPVDFTLPMVSPDDIGQFAARFLMEPIEKTGLQEVEGPKQYSSNDVAAAFSTALNKPVKAIETPPDQWLETLKKMGFSDVAAKSMAAMTKLTKESKEEPKSPNRGSETLEEYVKKLVEKK